MADWDWAERMKRAAALRHTPMVEAWIAAYQRYDAKHGFYKKTFPDCRHCGYPHIGDYDCNNSTFGLVRFGCHDYTVSHSNLEAYVSMRSAPRKGFHWRDDFFFERTDEAVVVRYYSDFNGHPNQKELRIPLLEFKSIADAMLNCSALPQRGEPT
jgi:hypothetical protein